MSSWEHVSSLEVGDHCRVLEMTDRLRVPSGYLYRTIVHGRLEGQTAVPCDPVVNVIFVRAYFKKRRR